MPYTVFWKDGVQLDVLNDDSFESRDCIKISPRIAKRLRLFTHRVWSVGSCVKEVPNHVLPMAWSKSLKSSCL